MQKNQIYAIIVVVVIVGAAGAYFLLTPSGPQRKNSIVWETIGNPQYLDPHTDYESFGSWISYNVYETLYTYDFDTDSTAPSVPLLASALAISGDGLNYTFTLRSGIKFHDGTPFNASCVKWNFERGMAIFDPDGPVWMFAEPILGGQAVEDAAGEYGAGSTQHQGNYTAWVAMNSMIVLDTYTIRFRLAYAYAPFLAAITYEVGGMMSPSWVAAHGGITLGAHNTYVDTHTCGTGPYMVTSWVPDDHIQLDINPTYWRKSAALATHPYAGNITSITIKTNDEVNSRILNLKAGTTDGGYWPVSHSDQIWNRVNGTNGDGTRKSSIANLKLYCQDPTYDVMFIGFNMNPYINRSGAIAQSPFTIKSLRQSFSYAFNYAKFILNVLNGFGQQAQGPIPKTMLGHNDSLFMYQYDLDKAVTAWNLAMTQGLPAILANNSYKLEIYYNSGNTNRERACLLMKDGITAILADPAATQPASPLTVDVIALEWASYLYQVQNKQLPFFFLGWAPDYADPDNYVGPFVRSSGTYPKRIGLGNSAGWNKTQVDGWIVDAGKSTNVTERVILYGKIQQAIVDQIAYVWAYQAQSFDVESIYMRGYQYNAMHDPYFYYYYKTFAVGLTTP